MKTLFLLLTCVGVCLAGNIVLNPSFEDGTAWSASGWVFPFSFAAHTGSNSAATGCFGPIDPATGCFLEQTLSTIPGQSYDLRFWVFETGGPTSEVLVQWDGATVLDILNPNNNARDWLELTVPGLPASTASTVLKIFGRQDPAGLAVDDVVVDAAVPEPATFGLACLALAAFTALRRRRRIV